MSTILDFLDVYNSCMTISMYWQIDVPYDDSHFFYSRTYKWQFVYLATPTFRESQCMHSRFKASLL